MVNSIKNAGSRVAKVSEPCFARLQIHRGFHQILLNVLGFVRVKRPGSIFDFNGAWLFNYGIGIHLLQSAEPDNLPKKTEINPRDNHISFQCDSVQSVERKVQELKIKSWRTEGYTWTS